VESTLVEIFLGAHPSVVLKQRGSHIGAASLIQCSIWVEAV
jgi:hypothetical protein